MKIAILGTGAMGSAFAYQLAKAGHEVTVIARSERLQQLERDQAIVTTSGERVPVRVAGALDETIAYDLVLVVVLATQVDSVLPAIRASAAKKVMFMFNTFEPLDRLREAAGTDRFTFGFPGGVFSLLIDGKIAHKVNAGTTVGDAAWGKIFAAAGIPTAIEPDMFSWLRSHAAFVAPMMAMGTLILKRGKGLSWAESRAHAQAMATAFHLVTDLGNTILPTAIRKVSGFPLFVHTALFWMLSRTQTMRDLGKLGTAEPRMLIDQMTAVAPGKTAPLLAIRP